MSYPQLTEGKRYQISAFLAQGFTPAAIARTLKVHRTTVCRELRRNACDGHYDPAQAHRQALKRRGGALKYRIPPSTIEYVKLALSLECSPEQISGLGDRIGMPVSHEWIYRYVAADTARRGRLYKALRQGHKRYRRGVNRKRGVIPSPRSIDERPAAVETRERFGDLRYSEDMEQAHG